MTNCPRCGLPYSWQRCPIHDLGKGEWYCLACLVKDQELSTEQKKQE